jgi:hypothetical protein
MNTKGHLSIPKPCHENWLNMSLEEKGRHCSVCCKTVMDFTAMPTEKVIELIAQKGPEKVCGRFRPDQLASSPVNKTRHRYRIFMAALYFVFGGLLFTSCRPQKDDVKMGKVQLENSFVPQPENNLDTPSSRMKNKTSVKNENTGAKHKIAASDTLTPEIHMLGEVIYMPADTTEK